MSQQWSGRLRRVAVAPAVVAGLVASMLAVPVGVETASAAIPATVHLVGPLPFEEVRSVSPDGRFAIVGYLGSERSIALPVVDYYGGLTGRGFVAHDGGTFAFRAGGLRSIIRVRVATGEADEIVVPLEPQRAIERFIAADASGTSFLIEVRSLEPTTGYPFTTYLYDSTTGSLIAPFGLRFGALDPGPVGRSLSADGRFVTGYASVFRGSTYAAQYWRRDVVTGELVVRDEPFESYGLLQPAAFVASDDLEWGAFVAEAAGVVPGLPAGRRLYRRNFLSGVTEVVPVDAAAVVRFGVYDGGRVVVSHRLATPADPDSVQVSVWGGAGPAQLLTIGTNAQPADLGVERIDGQADFVANKDASRVTFTSSSTNLVAGATTPETRLYQVVLPPLERQDASRPVRPDESVCTAVPGAAPGEFVGVNVTPVSATAAGYGVVHSSDERAGLISNVNFGPGSVDPNVAFAQVGVDGAVCFTNSRHGSVHVVVDAMVVGDDAALRPIQPGESARRLLDTRPDQPVRPSEVRCTPTAVAEAGEFVGVNVTPVGATSAGFGTMHGSGAAPLGASTVNFAPGSVDPNFAFVQVGADREICFTNSVHATVDLIVDQLVVVDETAMRPPTPGPNGVRLVDTRVGLGGSRLGPTGSACVLVPGAAGGEFLAANITPVGAGGDGFGTLHTLGVPVGSTSNVNFRPGSFDPNLAMAVPDVGGVVCFTNSVHTAVDVVIDAQAIGSASSFRTATPDGAVRLLDTRVALP